MRFRFLAVIAALSLCLGATGCAFLPPKLVLPDTVATVEQLEPYLEDAVSSKTPPSVSVGVVRDGKVAYAKSFGYSDSLATVEASPDTVYQWWSLTKLFTVVAILQLQEQGLLSIDDPVAQHLPTFKVRGKQGKGQEITIKHLLSHSSGLGDIGMEILGWVHFDGDPHPVQTEFFNGKVEKFNKLKKAPGEEGRYSNFGYLALAAVIESVSGAAYEKYVVDNITVPLDMQSTHFIYTPTMERKAATGSHPNDFISKIVPIYLDTDRAVKEKRDNILWFNPVYSDQKGSTGLIGSVNDLMKFMNLFLADSTESENPVLGSQSLNLMKTPVVKVVKSPAPVKNLQFGLGWFIGESDGELTLTHGGSGMAFVSMLTLYPERKLGTVVVANSTYLGRTMGFGLSQLLGQLDW